MKKMFYLLAAGAISIAPAMTLAGPGGHGGGMGHGHTARDALRMLVRDLARPDRLRCHGFRVVGEVRAE